MAESPMYLDNQGQWQVRKQELVEKLEELLCQYCDGISSADECELDKSVCPVLKAAPSQILALIRKAGWKSGEEVYDQTMQAKKSGWDDCMRFHKFPVQETVRKEIGEQLNSIAVETLYRIVERKEELE